MYKFDVPYMSEIAGAMVLGGIIGNSDFIGFGNITKTELLDIIGRQINREPKALKLLLADHA